MSVGIAQKNLRGTIWTRLPGSEIGSHIFEVAFPRIKIIHSQSEMIVFMARKKRRPQIGNQMQFLV